MTHCVIIYEGLYGSLITQVPISMRSSWPSHTHEYAHSNQLITCSNIRVSSEVLVGPPPPEINHQILNRSPVSYAIFISRIGSLQHSSKCMPQKDDINSIWGKYIKCISTCSFVRPFHDIMSIAMVQEMACCTIGTKPLILPKLICLIDRTLTNICIKIKSQWVYTLHFKCKILQKISIFKFSNFPSPHWVKNI